MANSGSNTTSNKKRSKRPKVRYIVIYNINNTPPFGRFEVIKKGGIRNKYICSSIDEPEAARVAAALNLREAVRRGELKVV